MSLRNPNQNQETFTGDSVTVTVWNYFIKKQNNNNYVNVNAECTLCSNILKISKGSYKGLKIHLKTKHCIDLSSENTNLKHSSPDSSSKPSSSKTVLADIISEEEIPKKKSKLIDSYFKKENSMEMMISRMVCKDGVPLNLFCTSRDLRYLFSKSGFQLPNSPNTVRSIVSNFANTVKADLTSKFEYLKQQQKRFSLSFNEWTSQKNHRYLNLTVHYKIKYFNLGLIRIHGSCTVEHTISLIENRLKGFGLTVENDIIGMSIDGASGMVKVGKLMNCYQQLCYAHGLQLTVLDVLYKKRRLEEVAKPTTLLTIYESDTDDEDTSNDALDEQGVAITLTDFSMTQLTFRYVDIGTILQKVRKVVKLFKSSPTKYDIYLQRYVKEDTGKELSLILDCRTRWDSLLAMIERFYKLKVCINKALIDIGYDIKFSDIEWLKIKNLIDCLQLFKLAVETLCRKDSTLITAETTLKFVLEELLTHDTVLSADLSKALRARIKERRTIVTGILIYLQNPKKYREYLNRADNTFIMPKIKNMRLEMKKILERFHQNHVDDSLVELGEEIGEKNLEFQSQKDLTLKEKLELQIQQEMMSFTTQTKNITDFDNILKKEMTTFESEGVRGKYLSVIQDHLLTIRPTSIEAGRAFSAGGYICTSVRSQLADETISTICFLRSFFQTKN